MLLSDIILLNWLGVMFGALLYTAQRPGHQENWSRGILSFKMWCWRRMEKIKWSEKVTNGEVLDCIGEKRTLPNNIVCKKAKDRSHSEKKLPPS